MVMMIIYSGKSENVLTIEKIIPPLQGLFLLGVSFSEAVGLARVIIPFQGI
jgi:hypothetical protein